MGCDIHIVVERRQSGRSTWVGLYSSDAAYSIIRKNMIAARRDYAFFACLAAVRGDAPEGVIKMYPRNLPEDMSELSREQFWRAPTDHHSASYATPEEFARQWLAANNARDDRFQQKDVRPEFAIYDLLGIEADERGDEFRVVFWFDN